MRFFLFQLRAFVNAGFSQILVLTGHAGGNQVDLRLVARCFEAQTNCSVVVRADPELVEGSFSGDHAGMYEISQLLSIRPDLVKMERMHRVNGHLGRQAQGDDATKANARLGKEILELSLTKIGGLLSSDLGIATSHLSYEETNQIWQEIVSKKEEWISIKPRDGQRKVSESSRWANY